MAMQDLRLLIAERSRIAAYVTGETIEVPPHSIAFLQEGFVKSHTYEQLIKSPAALCPTDGDSSLPNGAGHLSF